MMKLEVKGEVYNKIYSRKVEGQGLGYIVVWKHWLSNKSGRQELGKRTLGWSFPEHKWDTFRAYYL